MAAGLGCGRKSNDCRYRGRVAMKRVVSVTSLSVVLIRKITNRYFPQIVKSCCELFNSISFLTWMSKRKALGCRCRWDPHSSLEDVVQAAISCPLSSIGRP